VTHFKTTGTGAIYHVFLPKGVDTCFDLTSVCYSPDYQSSFVFCAYHSVFMYQGKPVIFSVEPWMDATVTFYGKTFPACGTLNVPKGTNRTDNSTASVLAHESIEAFTDPLPGSGWINFTDGQEIGDECQAFSAVETLGSAKYYIQKMYSNSVHACADSQ